MKGNITNWLKEKDKRPQRRRILCVLVAIIAIVILLLLLRQCGCSDDGGNTSQAITPTGAANTLPTLGFGDNDGREELGGNSTGMKFTATSGFVFAANQIDQNARFVNHEDNPYPFKVMLYLADGTAVYESGYIHPGDSIEKIRLSQKLSVGVYKKALMVYRVYSSDLQNAISQYEFPIEIKVK